MPKGTLSDIALFGRIFGPNIYKILGKPLFKSGFIYIDGWSFLHLVLFYMIGLFYPNHWTYIIIGSILFESLEKFSSTEIKFLREFKIDTLSDFGINLLGYWLAHVYPMIFG